MATVYRRDMAVQSLLKNHPNATWVFGRLGIDPDEQCTISNAAQREDLPVDLLLAALEATDPAAALGKHASDDNFEASFQGAITNFIEVSHHVFMREQFPLLEKLLDKAVKADCPSHVGMLKALREVFLPFRANVEKHLEIEEDILFPRLRNIDGHAPAHKASTGAHTRSSPIGAIEEMEHQHDLMEEALREMRSLTSDYTLGDDASDELAALYDELQKMELDLTQHIRLENDYLQPMQLMQAQPPDVSHAPQTGAPTVDEASLICPQTNLPCEQGCPAECSQFWDCVRMAMQQRWAATNEK